MIYHTAPKPVSYKISVTDFKAKFTGSEMRAIDQAALTDDNIYRYEKLVNAVLEVDLRNKETINGLTYLVQLGILTHERASSIIGFSLNIPEVVNPIISENESS